MTRRTNLPRRLFLKLPAVAGLALLPAGCLEGEADGPVPVTLGRDTCEMCRMILSDIRFAAEIRGGPKNRLFKFDDIGCAVRWAAQTPWTAEPGTRIWAMNFDDGRTWLDAPKAVYRPGPLSPMGYGYAAVPAPEPGSLSYEELKAAVLKQAGCSQKDRPS